MQTVIRAERLRWKPKFYGRARKRWDRWAEWRDLVCQVLHCIPHSELIATATAANSQARYDHELILSAMGRL